MSAQPRSAVRVLLLAMAGALTGYILWKAYHALGQGRPELVAVLVTHRNVELLGALLGNPQASRRVLEAMVFLVIATPGALLLGIPVGVALRYVAHRRLLLYSVLAWPLGTYAYSTFVLRVLDILPEQDQVALWYSRGVGARDAFFVYSMFFTIAYLAYLLAARAHPHTARSAANSAKTRPPS